ncbi:MAG: GntR family transcriptional regulator [Planctomycetota bacterium]
MFFSIDSSSDVAVYEQIVRQVQLAIADGTLVGGQMLPSVRQLARDLALNANTVARAYRDLQSTGVIDAQRGRGMTVRRDAVDACRVRRDGLVDEAFRRAIADAIAGGMTPEQLRAAFEDALSALPPNELAEQGATNE